MPELSSCERQICAVMETLEKAAVSELRALLDECSADATAAHSCCARCSATFPKDEEEESEETSTRTSHEALTRQFASCMAAWTRRAAEKIFLIMSVSVCEAEDRGAAERRAARAVRAKNKSASRSSHLKSKKTDGALQPARRKENDHMYCREEQHTDELAAAADSESVTQPADVATNEISIEPPSEPEALLTEDISELNSDVSREDVIQEDADAAGTTNKIQKKTTGPFKCPSCDKSFALKCFMDRHYLTHSKPHCCSECGKCFAVPRGLIAHSRRHTGEKLYKCSDCGTEFAYKSTFDRHMRQHCLKRQTHTCTLCENQFTSLLALQRHRCCALKKTFVCSLCPETFVCRQSLADHENLHSGDRDFVCEMCGKSFLSSSSLATHRVTHMQKENCCDVLGLGCSDLSVLKNHLCKHTGEKLFSCEVCGKGCSHKSALKHHMLTHTGERPYICETCGKRCGHASALQNHMRIHTGKKPGQQPVCNMCGKKVSSMVKLKYHMSIHTGEKPYACDQCDKKFSNPSNLKVHERVHSGEKMYGCNICNRRFTQSSSLKLHRLIHTGERPYQCVVCGKEFIHRSDFRKHQRSHVSDGDGPSEKTAVKI